MDYDSLNSLSGEELKAKFPGLYEQMCELIKKGMEGATVDDWAKTLELMQNSSVSDGNIYDANGRMIGGFNLDEHVSADNGEIVGTHGHKAFNNQVNDFIGNVKKRIE